MRTYYTEKEILDMFDFERPYQKSCVNYGGKAKKEDGKKCRYYSEVLAERILSKKFDLHPYDPDRKDFFVHELSDLSAAENPDESSEQGLCRYWCTEGYGFEKEIALLLGRPVDYETNIVSGTKVNIDLVSLSVEEEKAILYLIEVKGSVASNGEKVDSDETLLRCALEIETYYQSILKKKEQFIADFRKHFPELIAPSLPIELKKAVLIPKEGRAEEQWINQDDFRFLHQLVKDWDILVVTFDPSPRHYDK